MRWNETLHVNNRKKSKLGIFMPTLVENDPQKSGVLLNFFFILVQPGVKNQNKQIQAHGKKMGIMYLEKKFKYHVNYINLLI